MLIKTSSSIPSVIKHTAPHMQSLLWASSAFCFIIETGRESNDKVIYFDKMHEYAFPMQTICLFNGTLRGKFTKQLCHIGMRYFSAKTSRRWMCQNSVVLWIYKLSHYCPLKHTQNGPLTKQGAICQINLTLHCSWLQKAGHKWSIILNCAVLVKYVSSQKFNQCRQHVQAHTG